jgi:y4mF family transcriptional regulator
MVENFKTKNALEEAFSKISGQTAVKSLYEATGHSKLQSLVKQVEALTNPTKAALDAFRSVNPDIQELAESFRGINYLPTAQTAAQVKTNKNKKIETKVLTTTDLGLVFKEKRKTTNFNQQKLADIAGVGRRFISELENGKQSLEFGKILKVASVLGIDLFARPR